MNEQQEALSGETNVPKWGDSFNELSAERKQELARRLWAWKPEMTSDERNGPFCYEALNGLEVFWLAVCALAGPEGDVGAAEHTLRWAQGDQARSHSLQLSRLNLAGAELVYEAHLENAVLNGAHLEEADFSTAYLKGAYLNNAYLEGACFNGEAHLEGACLNRAHLEKGLLAEAHLEGADLRAAYLQGADLYAAHLEGADLRGAYLEGTA